MNFTNQNQIFHQWNANKAPLSCFLGKKQSTIKLFLGEIHTVVIN